MNANQVFLKKFSKNLNINNKSSSFCYEKMLEVCTLYFEYCNLFIRKYLFPSIKSLVRHFQYKVRQKSNLVRHLVLPQIFLVR